MYISRVVLKNICGIRNLDLRLTDSLNSDASTVLIGKNATGKSSVLRAIVLGLASQTEANALLAEPFGTPFVHTGECKGIIKLELIDGKGAKHCLKKKITRDSEENELVTSVPKDGPNQTRTLVVAFGAGRSNEGAELSRIRYTIVDSAFMLFNYEGTFIQPELTLRRLEDYVGTEEYANITSRIRSALQLGPNDVLEFQRGGGVVVSGPFREEPIPIHSWADGYRITLNWILDIYAWAMRFGGSMDEEGNVSGILLIDEIEQHLHPSMQRRIVADLKVLFPSMQIVASSHSPLVIQSLNSHQIISLHRDGPQVNAAALRDYSGFSVEDLLTAAELFETPPYSVSIEEARQEYRSLIARGDLAPEEQETLLSLARVLAGARILQSRNMAESIEEVDSRLSEVIDDTGR